MTVFRCKMCGANLTVTPGMEICECESCGTNQTLPKFTDERRVTMYERANHFRRNSEFDKAMNMYEQILNEDRTDAEAYWSIVLCRYGIEYVEDPSTRKRVPTINRSQHTSIFADEDYKEALKCATLSQKSIFESEAKTIDDIQKGILEISRKEEPFDVFICYKESDSEGARTKDSVIANDIYHQLTREGFKVFFAAITLEDKLGQAYEPYIFAALNSAKVMIVLGTRPEYFNAPWVKNEWSRYLKIIKSDPKKILIPAYRDMDAYDLPEEFSFLQAQDMAKIGFMNDLIHGIKKVVNADKDNKPSVSVNVPETVIYNKINEGTGVEQALKRATFLLEDGDWNSASTYFEKALDLQPECAEAYVGKLMLEYGIRRREDLSKQTKPFTHNEHFVRALKFADGNLKKELEKYDNDVILGIVASLEEDFEKAVTEKDFETLIERAQIISYHDGIDEFVERCENGKLISHKEMIYSSAIKIKETAKYYEDYLKLISMFGQITDYKDSTDKIAECNEALDRLSATDSKCVICREKEGIKTFVPGDPAKCCEKCMMRLNLLYMNKGRRSDACTGSIQYLSERMQYIARKTVRDRIQSIIDTYTDSIPEFKEKQAEQAIALEKPVREKTEYELQEEKRLREEEQRRRDEERRKEIERQKQIIIEKNAAYEYDVQVVIDKASGGTDTDMLRHVLAQNATSGWKLHSVVIDKISDGAPIGQTILVFERRIKAQDGK
ncbi:MAG: toll/interleukin-1 receptor domain-containing protein [Lachnospiraceae bacterium]|nr:toll/interleukin-1 receptor domain-containing protein [Lachnospiraceae bacterium]